MAQRDVVCPFHGEPGIIEASATCACGRAMLVDPLRGAGSFRCSCGNRVTVTITPPASRPRTRCIGSDFPGGAPCLEESVPHPYFGQLCERHHERIFWLARNIVENELEGEGSEEIYRRRRAWRLTHGREWALSEDETVAHMELHDAVSRETTLDEWQWLNRVRRGRPTASWIYYLRHGDKIKIGTSVDPPMRVQHLSLPPESLLATEPGGLTREKELHAYWAPVRAHGEWFWAVPALLAYVEELKAKSPAPN